MKLGDDAEINTALAVQVAKYKLHVYNQEWQKIHHSELPSKIMTKQRVCKPRS